MRAITLSLLISLSVQPAFACRLTKPLSDEEKGKIEVLFIGEPIRTEFFDKDQGNGQVKARVTYQTIKTLKGKNQDQWTVYQPFDWFGSPTSLAEFKQIYGERNEVGISVTETYLNQPVIVSSGVCGTPYILPAK